MTINEIFVVAMWIAFIALLFTGFPVGWILGGVAVVFAFLAIMADTVFDAYLGINWNFASLVVDRVWDTMKNWVLVALPLFIFMGLMLDRSGITDRMMSSFVKLFGAMRGGYAVVVLLIGVLLAASTGIVGASVTLLALLGLPVMLKANYSPALASGTCAAVGTLGILIPPSIMLVLMGDRLGISVGDLFLGALFPGLLLGSMYLVYILLHAWLDPKAAPAPENREPITTNVLLDVAWAVLPALGLILAVLGTIFFGIATPTEAAGIGAFGALLLAGARRRLTLKVLREASRQTTKTTAYIFAIFMGATAFSLVLRGLGGDEFIEGMLKALPFGGDGLFISVLVFIFILGFFLDWIEITLIVLPLIGPVLKSYGMDPVWSTIVIAVMLQSSFLTPPVGFSLFYLKGVAPKEITTGHVYRGIIPFNIAILATVVIVYVWKDVVLWLPKAAYGGG